MSTTVLVRGPAAREVPSDTFADLTAAALVSVLWTPPALLLTFDGDLTPAEVLRVQLRAKSQDAVEEQILANAVQALQGNRDYLALVAPDAAAVRVQVARLTRIQNGLIRRLVGLYDGTD